jgi:hypothetical protein
MKPRGVMITKQREWVSCRSQGDLNPCILREREVSSEFGMSQNGKTLNYSRYFSSLSTNHTVKLSLHVNFGRMST